MQFYYDNEGKVSSMRYKGITYYYVKNLQGDVTKLIKSDGTTVANYTYNPWGEIISITDGTNTAVTANDHIAKVNPFRYRGYVYDDETGLYYLMSRYYDPSTGRFINADTYIDTLTGTTMSPNMFSYCENNPVKYIDISGEKTTISAWHFKYNRKNAVKYAPKWWNSRNSQYYSYGQDCTNFVSQCLYAGGIPMTIGNSSSTWHSFRHKKSGFNLFGCCSNNKRYNWDVSSPWRLCNDNYKYFKKSVYAKKLLQLVTLKKAFN